MIEIHPSQYDDWLILTICVAIDQMSHDERTAPTNVVHPVNQGNHLGGAIMGGAKEHPVAAGAAVASSAPAQSYAPPPAVQPAAQVPLPPGWAMQMDPATSRFFSETLSFSSFD